MLSNSIFDEMKKAWGITIGATIISTIIAFAVVWMIAPEVGGNFWPYIRFTLSALSGILVGRLTSTIVAGYVMKRFMNKKVDEVFDRGDEDSPWSQEDIDGFMDNFEMEAKSVDFNEVDEE